MGMVICSSHGLSGIHCITQRIASSIKADVPVLMHNVELRFEDIGLGWCVDDETLAELGLELDLSGGVVHTRSEQEFEELLGTFSSVCIKCFREYCARHNLSPKS